MKQTLTWRILALLVAASLFAAACGSDSDDASSSDTSEAETTESSQDTPDSGDDTSGTGQDAPGADYEPPALRVGYLLPATGDLSAIVDALVKPIEMGAEEINAGGGNVTLIPGDSGTDPTIAATAIDAILNDDANAVIGGAATTVSLAIIDKVTGQQVLQCSGSNTGAALTTVDDNGGYYIRTAPSDILQAPTLADVITDDGATSVAVVFRNDDYGSGFAGLLSDALEANGVTVAASIAYDPAATSFDAEVAEAAAAAPDAVAVITFGEGAQLMQAMIEAGAGPADLPVYVADGFKDTVTAEAIDPDNPAVIEGVRGTAPSAAPANGEATFGDRLEAFAPGTPTIFSGQKYDCLMVIALASAAAQSADPAVFAAVVNDVTSGGTKCTDYAGCLELIRAGEDFDYDGASGPLDFTDVGEPSIGTYDVYTYDAEGAAQTDDQIVAGS